MSESSIKSPLSLSLRIELQNSSHRDRNVVLSCRNFPPFHSFPLDIHSSLHPIHLHLPPLPLFHRLLPFPSPLPTIKVRSSILHLSHPRRLPRRPLPRMTDFLLDLLRLLPRRRRRPSHRLARAWGAGGLCDSVAGQALGLLPLAFEGARGLGLEGGGGVGVGAGGHGWMDC